MRTVSKPYKSLDDLVQGLIEKGLYIADKEFAKQAITSLSYYDLINGYKRYFTKNGRYLPDISIEFLYNFRLFDIDIQNIIFKYSVAVETRFKNILSMNLGERYGSHQDDYLNKFYYAHGSRKSEKRFNKMMSSIRNVYAPSDPTRKIDQPTKRYMRKYQFVPPWILLKNVTFSSAIDLFSFLNSDLKHKVAFDLLGTAEPRQDYKLALNCLYTIRKFRNAIAHNLGFISLRLTTPKAVSRSELEREFFGTMILENDPKKIASGDPYSMLLAMVLLLNDRQLIENMFYEITTRILKNEDASTAKQYSKITNIPFNIINRGQNFLDEKRIGSYTQLRFGISLQGDDIHKFDQVLKNIGKQK